MISRITDDRANICYMCGKYGTIERLDVHHIFEGSTRAQCDKDRLIVHLCRNCHNHVHSSKGDAYRRYLHELGQKVYEDQIGTREMFIKNYIKSYL